MSISGLSWLDVDLSVVLASFAERGKEIYPAAFFWLITSHKRLSEAEFDLFSLYLFLVFISMHIVYADLLWTY